MARYKIRWNDKYKCYMVMDWMGVCELIGKLPEAIRAKRRLIQLDREQKKEAK